jgi:uncharacterized protein (TIGR03435 family)
MIRPVRSGRGAFHILLLLFIGSPQLIAQAPLDEPSFEVTSIKTNKSGRSGGGISRLPGGRFMATNYTLSQLVAFAYQVEEFRMRGGPGWIRSDRFDIIAKAERDSPIGPVFGPPDQITLMVRALLVERFRLVVHTETREMPIYALVLARNDGTLGPRFRPTQCDDAPVSARASGRPCNNRGVPGSFVWHRLPMSQLTVFLRRQVQRAVVDRTGLTGTFDINLSWTPDQISGDREGPSPPPIDLSSTSIFTAVQEQLGLKLESTRGPVEILVIDRVEHPTED